MATLHKRLAECGYCKDCRWWLQERWVWIEGWGLCQIVKRDYGIPVPDNALMLPSDRIGPREWLQTAPDFGCVQFEAKEKTDG